MSKFDIKKNESKLDINLSSSRFILNKNISKLNIFSIDNTIIVAGDKLIIVEEDLSIKTVSTIEISGDTVTLSSNSPSLYLASNIKMTVDSLNITDNTPSYEVAYAPLSGTDVLSIDEIAPLVNTSLNATVPSNQLSINDIAPLVTSSLDVNISGDSLSINDTSPQVSVELFTSVSLDLLNIVDNSPSLKTQFSGTVGNDIINLVESSPSIETKFVATVVNDVVTLVESSPSLTTQFSGTVGNDVITLVGSNPSLNTQFSGTVGNDIVSLVGSSPSLTTNLSTTIGNDVITLVGSSPSLTTQFSGIIGNDVLSFVGTTPSIKIQSSTTSGISDISYMTVSWSTTPSTDLTDYVGYYDLSDAPQSWWDEVNTSDGAKMRVAKDDAPDGDTSVTELPFEVVNFDSTNQTGQLWFRWSGTLTSTSPNDVRIYPAKSSAKSYGVTDTYGRNAVWTNYQAVYHLNQDPSGTAPQITDVTGNGNNLTSSGNMTSDDLVSGLVGNAIDFDGNDALEGGAGNSPIDLTQAFTVYGFGYKRDLNDGGAVVGFTERSTGEFLALNLRKDEVAKIVSNGETSGAGTTILNDLQYYQVGMKYSGSGDIDAILNGAFEYSTTPSGTAWQTSNEIVVGDEPNSNSGLDGRVDEPRYTQQELSFDYLSLEFNNQNDPTSFWGTASFKSAMPDISYMTVSWSTTPSSNLNDYVGYYDLSDAPQSWWDAVDTTDGTKMRVTKDDSPDGNNVVTELPFDIVNFDSTNQTGQLWFKWSGTLPTTSPNDVRIYPAKSSNNSYAVTDTFGRNAVWSNAYTVYHFDSLPAVDASGTIADATTNGTPTIQSGKIGSAIQFDADGENIQFAHGGSADPYPIEVAAWVNADVGTTGTNRHWWTHGDFEGMTTGYAYNDFRTYSGQASDATSSVNGIINEGQWDMYHVLVDDADATNTKREYQNGSEVSYGGESTSVNTADWTPHDWSLSKGLQAFWSGYLGKFDEFRIRQATTIDYKSFEYANQNDPSTFWGSTSFKKAMPDTTYMTVPWNTTPTSDLTDYVGYYDLSNAPQSWWDEVNTNDGTKLRVAKDDVPDGNALATELPFDVVNFDSTNQTGQLWFKWGGTLSSTSPNNVRIYCAKSSNTSYTETDTYGRNAVWVNDLAVHHMATTADATGNGNTLLLNGTATVGNNTGKIGNFADYPDGNSNHITVSDPISDASFSVMTWFKYDQSVDDLQFIMDNGDYVSGGFQVFVDNPDVLRFRIDDHGSNGNAVSGTTTLTTDTWYLIHLVADKSGNASLYLDGSLEASFDISSYGDISGTVSAGIYYGRSDSNSYDGINAMDETRIQQSVFSADRIDFQYANQNDLSTFWGSPTLIQ